MQYLFSEKKFAELMFTRECFVRKWVFRSKILKRYRAERSKFENLALKNV